MKSNGPIQIYLTEVVFFFNAPFIITKALKGFLHEKISLAEHSEKQPVNYFSFVALSSARVWLMLNNVLALLFSLFYVIHEFDGSS